MIYILDRNYKVYRILDIDYKFIKEMNKLNTLEFTTDFDIPKGDYVVLKDDGKYYEFVVVDSDYSREDNYSYDYYCQDTLLEINGFVIEDKKPNRNVIQHLEIIFADTGWEIVNKGDFTTNEVQINYYRISVLEAFKKVLETFEIEWETNFIADNGVIVRRQLIIGKVGKKVNSRLEFEKNIKRFERKILPEPIYTALIGLGKGKEKVDEEGNSTGGYGRKITFADVNNGSWYIGDEEARLKYGIGKAGNKNHYFGFVTFADETDKNKLLVRTKEELKKASRPQAEYTIDVANINIDVNLGDEVPAIDEVLGFRDYLKVVKVEKTKLSTELTFGVMTRAFSSLSDANGESIAEKVTEMVGSRFSEELNRVVNNFNNEDGYNYDLKAGNKYNLPAGYYSFNKPIDENPTKVTYLGAGKVLIADEKGSDGSWKWDTAIDGNGIYGGEIIGHSITANKLAPDVGQSLDLSSNKSINLTVKKTTQSYIDENKDQLKGDKGDKGERGLQGLQGPTGEQGIPGKNGKDGTSSYTHIAYANSSDGKKDFSVSDSTNKLYIGMYVNEKKSDSDDPKKYKWTLIKGQDGKNGTPGAKGDDGKTPYLHIAYSNSADGKKDFSVDDSNRSYIGQYTNYEKEDSTDPKKYTWSKIKGDKGAKGDKGDTGEADYTQFRKEYSAELNNLGDRIESIVESTNTSSEDTLNALSELNQSLNGTMSEEDVQKLIDELNDKISEDRVKTTQTSKSYTQKFERIEAGIENSKAELVKLSGVIKSGLDENGKTYTDWIGDGDNRVRVGSDGIVMLSSNAETLKLKDGRGYMNSLYVKHELGLGNHTARKMGTEFTVFMPMGGQNELDS